MASSFARASSTRRVCVEEMDSTFASLMRHCGGIKVVSEKERKKKFEILRYLFCLLCQLHLEVVILLLLCAQRDLEVTDHLFQREEYTVLIHFIGDTVSYERV